ncbi:MAG: anhydro-N-acetylmuramic acid kinase [Pseudomonadota bacterium]
MTDSDSTPCVIGLISGTSGDGIDVALVSFGESVTVVHAETASFEAGLHADIKAALTAPDTLTAAEFGRLHVALGCAFADAAQQVRNQHKDLDVIAIASHGQTLFHAPGAAPSFTLQAGDAATIAHRCGLPVIADFRAADMAAGGEGAPLAPLFHSAVLAQPDEHLAVVNLGGIANLTVIQPDSAVRGFDTGPANALMDVWSEQHFGQPFDTDGAIAASGRCHDELLSAMRADPYFQKPPPKSTGREYFNAEWLKTMLRIGNVEQLSQQDAGRRDIMATLLELTASTVADAIKQHSSECAEVLLCGGGAANQRVVDALRRALPSTQIASTASRGIDPDFVEAALIAWLGWQRWQGQPVDTRAITGASRVIFAGDICLPPDGIEDE